ncbi:MAG TPA: HlyD family secretion protein [Nitrospirota bacterium]|nr:HlyD family secretion protein [Nitrospirota bacterium]
MAEEQVNTSENNLKKKRAFVIVGVLVAVGLVAGYFYNAYRQTHISTDDAFIEGDIHTIAAKINGTVKDIYVHDNQPVKKGDLLVEIDPIDYDVRLREAVSALDVEKAKLIESESRIETAKANLDLARANLKLAETDKVRSEKLIAEHAIPQERYDRAMTTYEVSVAQVKAAEDQLRQAESQKVTQFSTIRQREAVMSQANLNYKYTKITAPVDGYITKKNVQIGNQILAGQPLMALVSLTDIWVTANYKETQMTNIKPGQRAEISVDSYPGRVFTGKVDSIMAGTGVSFALFPPENASGNYVKVVQRIPVKIVLDEGTDKGHSLRIGMSVEPTVIIR